MSGNYVAMFLTLCMSDPYIPYVPYCSKFFIYRTNGNEAIQDHTKAQKNE